MGAVAQRLEVTLEGRDEPLVIDYDARDVRAWESQNRTSALNGLSVRMLTWFAWHAGRRTGVLNGIGETLEAFEAVCVDVDVRPTRRSRTRTEVSDGSSAPSPSEPESPSPS